MIREPFFKNRESKSDVCVKGQGSAYLTVVNAVLMSEMYKNDGYFLEMRVVPCSSLIC